MFCDRNGFCFSWGRCEAAFGFLGVCCVVVWGFLVLGAGWAENSDTFVWFKWPRAATPLCGFLGHVKKSRFGQCSCKKGSSDTFVWFWPKNSDIFVWFKWPRIATPLCGFRKTLSRWGKVVSGRFSLGLRHLCVVLAENQRHFCVVWGPKQRHLCVIREAFCDQDGKYFVTLMLFSFFMYWLKQHQYR